MPLDGPLALGTDDRHGRLSVRSDRYLQPSASQRSSHEMMCPWFLTRHSSIELFDGFNRLLETLAELLISGDRQDREFARRAHPFESLLQVIERREDLS